MARKQQQQKYPAGDKHFWSPAACSSALLSAILAPTCVDRDSGNGVSCTGTEPHTPSGVLRVLRPRGLIGKIEEAGEQTHGDIPNTEVCQPNQHAPRNQVVWRLFMTSSHHTGSLDSHASRPGLYTTPSADTADSGKQGHEAACFVKSPVPLGQQQRCQQDQTPSSSHKSSMHRLANVREQPPCRSAIEAKPRQKGRHVMGLVPKKPRSTSPRLKKRDMRQGAVQFPSCKIRSVAAPYPKDGTHQRDKYLLDVTSMGFSEECVFRSRGAGRLVSGNLGASSLFGSFYGPNAGGT